MKKLIIVTVCIVAISFAVVAFKFKSGGSSSSGTNQNSNTQTQPTDQTQSPTDPTSPDQTPKLVVSADQLIKLKAQNLVSADEKYYIKVATPFPSIVDLVTGSAYPVRPSANYKKITNLSWSGDGQTLVYIYQVSDPEYVGQDLLNTLSVSEVVKQKFLNSARVLVAAGKLDYVWYDAEKILVSQLNNFDPVKKFYADASLGIYDVNTDQFEYPLSATTSLNNLYSITLAAGAQKFLYVQAKLDSSGSTVGQQYVVSQLDGTIVSTSNAYDPNWSK